MWASYFTAAARHLGRNKLYAAIGVFGLGVGLWAALLAALEIHAEFSYLHFIPGYERVYRVLNKMQLPGEPFQFVDSAHNRVASQAVLQFPQLAGATRLAGQTLTVRKGRVSAREHVEWADPNFFQVLPMPVVAGDLANSLQRPESVVLTRSMARKYFNRDDPVGQTLTLSDASQSMGPPSAIGTRSMVVTAVIEDIPEIENQFEARLFASGAASYSLLTALDTDPANGRSSGWYGASTGTFLRLKPGASIDSIRRGVSQLERRVHDPMPGDLLHISFDFVRLDRLNSHPGLHPEFSGLLTMLIVLGAVTLTIAAANFVNLMSARLGLRAREVAVRKVTGADRHVLILQSLTESVLYALVAMAIAVALTEWTLPFVNAFLETDARFEYWRDPGIALALVGAALLVGALAGAYPALVLSAFRPLSVLKGLGAHSSHAGIVRQALVTLQFAILAGLMICAAVIYQQRTFATGEALRVSADQVLMIRSPCKQPFVTALRNLQGVRGAVCTGMQLTMLASTGTFPGKDKKPVTANVVPTDLGVFDVLGVRPLAGRIPLSANPGTNLSDGQYVINETAARAFGYGSAQAAVGQKLDVSPFAEPSGATRPPFREIAGVVPDFSFYPVTQKIMPTVYVPQENQFRLIAVKLTGRRIPQTLEEIARAWDRSGGEGPIDRQFLNDQIQKLYRSTLRQSLGFGVLGGVAILLACVGLLGMSAATAQRRTREVGIRKAMGAATPDIFRLMLWTFAKPVLWASLVAWAVTGWVMNRWLEGFAYHVDLHFWVFLAAAAIASTIALLTVSAHLVAVARAKPVAALRYE
jgi:putative ABC transport system permease protein